MGSVSYTVEVCCDHLESAMAAQRCGADRIELCAGLSTGGLTPDLATWEACLESLDIPVHILIRPRPGGFVYSTREKKLILRTIQLGLEMGVSGLVFGALTKEGTLDESFLMECLKQAPDLSWTFHRAFDLLENPTEALEKIIFLGFDRVLTSGGKSTCIQGRTQIQDWVQQSKGRISMMPGGGINSSNVTELLNIPGITEIHLSAKKIWPGGPGAFSTDLWLLDEEELTKVIRYAKG